MNDSAQENLMNLMITSLSHSCRYIIVNICIKYYAYFIRIVSEGNAEARSRCCINVCGPYITNDSKIGGSSPKHCFA